MPAPPAAPRNSILQEAVLAVLADGEFATVADIFARIGLKRTPVARVTMSRALSRLAEKGLVERWTTKQPLQGNGYLWRLKAVEHVAA